MPKPNDIFMTWKINGQLEAKLALIESLASKRIIQSEIANQLGISAKTFIKLKKKYPQIVEALNKGEESLKVNIMDAMLKRALGFKETDEVQVLEIVNGKFLSVLRNSIALSHGEDMRKSRNPHGQHLCYEVL